MYLIHFNPYHDHKNGQFTKSPIDKSSLPSFGGEGVIGPLFREVKGYDNLQKVYEDDYVIKKGSQYERITKTKDEKFNKRTYVSGGYYQYDEILSNLGDASYVDIYQTKRDAVIAGKNTIESVLKDIGGESADKIIKALNTNWLDKDKSNYYLDSDGKAYVDFLYEDKYGIADEFISKLKSRGYDGLPDPLDSGMGLSGQQLDDDATIFINDVLDKKLSTEIWI